MQINLNLGTVNIDDQELAKFIKNKNREELKTIFIESKRAIKERYS